MPLNKLKYLDSELKQIDAEHLDVKIPEDSEHAKEIEEMRKGGVSLDDVKTAD